MARPSIPAGTLDRRVGIWRAELVDDGTATVLGDFVEIGRRSAKRTDASDAERMRAAAVEQELTTRFLVRSDSLTRTVTGKDRLICEGQTFEVTGAKEWGGRRNGIEITAIARPDLIVAP